MAKRLSFISCSFLALVAIPLPARTQPFDPGLSVPEPTNQKDHEGFFNGPRVQIHGTAGDFLEFAETKRGFRPVVLILPAVVRPKSVTDRYNTWKFPQYLRDKGYSVALLEPGPRNQHWDESLGLLIGNAILQIDRSSARFGIDPDKVILFAECDAFAGAARAGLDPEFVGSEQFKRIRAVLLVENSCSSKSGSNNPGTSMPADSPADAPPFFVISVPGSSSGGAGEMSAKLRAAHARVEQLAVTTTVWHSESSRLGGWMNADAERIYEFLVAQSLLPKSN